MVAIFSFGHDIFFIFGVGLGSSNFIGLLFGIVQAVVFLIVDFAFFYNLKSLVEGLKLNRATGFLVVFDCSQGVNRSALDNVKRAIICFWLFVEVEFKGFQ